MQSDFAINIYHLYMDISSILNRVHRGRGGCCVWECYTLKHWPPMEAWVLPCMKRHVTCAVVVGYMKHVFPRVSSIIETYKLWIRQHLEYCNVPRQITDCALYFCRNINYCTIFICRWNQAFNDVFSVCLENWPFITWL